MDEVFSITYAGGPLPIELYSIDREKRIVTTKEERVCFDFGSDWTFKTGGFCTFHTGSGCLFNTKYCCTFDTGSYCSFRTGNSCAFHTGNHCYFITKENCTLLCFDSNKGTRYFLDDSSYIWTDGTLKEIKNMNDALLNIRHEDPMIRHYCEKLIKGEI